ncbi:MULTISPECIES: monofunctional biosynthetic peptidoglycan transglycosylase [Salegentibacter]|jgi:monofunctional biosynthetic peptidoglycan transglycosylase|uniref:Biosynthetic peptidoglycan transglycosylase n=1 Tax=Salegentibacter agarivorans TaxID=345907 RepID=A0A1I2M7E9_9FLAO|nr:MULTISPECIES: monofunctional biosynthetic peptidoglycan transglycosylase [Salegentibacter]APS38210.1 monofunctional biosynthetic peptidoglycan transglycosylase [Salegentibacter sp. T436]MBZ9630879.1 monofunctional biosynthetic peptidoglycan transglycosylase [Salegentibacter lacus]SFF85356.1 monofunctional biosynthetic peptidoglycan transglycosylase [Salegentibacter agarivorans]|tara:strand:+ start:1245 stop:1916 length:672 start_codon:yes stop_codon:yes gene_type:complete
MIKKIFKFLLKLAGILLLFSLLIVLLFKWFPVPFTPLMAIRYFENPEEKIQHSWVPRQDISRHLQLGVIASEDQNFVKHNGFDIEAIEKAIEDNQKGKRVRGASTISQQTAKNVFLWPGRNWLRKGLEVYFTFLIETFWSKERILEVYLNSIEMGRGIYGAEAAAQHWFNKSAANLSVYEAAAIAAILPNPREYRANPASNYINQRKNWIVRQMQNYGKFSLE